MQRFGANTRAGDALARSTNKKLDQTIKLGAWS